MAGDVAEARQLLAVATGYTVFNVYVVVIGDCISVIAVKGGEKNVATSTKNIWIFIMPLLTCI